MKQTLTITYDTLQWEELDKNDQVLVEKAKNSCKYSYAPFSEFHVGCALQLEEGVILTGNNQENASFPCGTCAERATIFYAHANYPHLAPEVIAIAARRKDGEYMERPLPPCGACRQALLEMETLFQKPIRMILYGTSESIVVHSIKDILPFQFEANMME